MVDILDYDKIETQEDDFGSCTSRIMAQLYLDHMRACHTNSITEAPPPFYKNPLVFGRLIINSILYNAQEKQWLRRMPNFQNESMGYLAIQSNKPQLLGFGLGDSPVGL